ncbi:glucosamine-6-phosphate deaminase [Rhizobium sullae]|nr:glucosamine-6-phosphate deaminase [Rhizobium sullae]
MSDLIMLVSSSQRLTYSTEAAVGQAVGDLIVEIIGRKPAAVLGLATGATMEPVYANLVAAFKRGDVSFAGVTSFNLDEYVGIPTSHPRSYRSTMNALFFDHVDIDKNRTFLPEASVDKPDEAGERYERMIAKAGGIDLQLLGIGRNGHIGFNEPGSAKDSRTRLVELHEDTLRANARFFSDRPVPSSAITMGIGTILSAKKIVLTATGVAKADAVRRATSGGFQADCPASALQEHDKVSWFFDRAAAGLRMAA